MKNKKRILFTALIFLVFFGFNMSVHAETVCCSKNGDIIKSIDMVNDRDSGKKCSDAGGYQADRSECVKVCCTVSTGNYSTTLAGCSGEDKVITYPHLCEVRYTEYMKVLNDSACVDKDIKDVLALGKKIYTFMKYIAPAILVILGSVDFMRATLSGSAEDMEKHKKRFFNRLVLAALVFLVLSIFQLVANILSSANITNGKSWIDCWNTLMLK